MTTGPATRRRYESPRRRSQAAATRAAILDAAGRLFAGRGYAATTMAAVAGEAGVALKTIYLAFGTKAGLLREVWNVRLRGGDDGVPMPERAWYRAMLAERAPEERLRIMARTSREVKERAAPILEAIRTAAQSEPEMADLWTRIGAEFHDIHLPLTRAMGEEGALREGLGADEAADVMWTLNHPAVWQLLVVERGWSPDRYEEWLRGAFCAELLGRRD